MSLSLSLSLSIVRQVMSPHHSVSKVTSVLGNSLTIHGSSYALKSKVAQSLSG